MKNQNINQIIEDEYDGKARDINSFQSIAKNIAEIIENETWDDDVNIEKDSIGNEFNLRQYIEDYLIGKYSIE